MSTTALPDCVPATEHLLGVRYQRVRVLGKGAFGEAILCTDMSTKAKCVVKRLKARVGDKELRQAMNEVTTLRRLRHPHIVDFVYAWAEPDAHLHICMEYCDGGDLHSYLPDHFPFTDEKVICCWAVQLLLAVAYMHSHRVIHRDIKLQNIFMMQPSCILKIGDFGLSKLLETTDESSRTQAGTPFYFSPEVAMGKPHNRKTDIWSLGVVLFQLLTRKMPFDGHSLLAVVQAIRTSPTPNPADFAPPNCHYSKALCDLVVSMLTKDVQRRPTAQEILQIPWIAELAAERPWVSHLSVRSDAMANLTSGATLPNIMVHIMPEVIINVRGGPSFTSDVVGRLRKGDVIHVVKSQRLELRNTNVRVTLHSTGDDKLALPKTMLWFEMTYPIKGFCIAEVSGEAVFELKYPALQPPCAASSNTATVERSPLEKLHDSGLARKRATQPCVAVASTNADSGNVPRAGACVPHVVRTATPTGATSVSQSTKAPPAAPARTERVSASPVVRRDDVKLTPLRRASPITTTPRRPHSPCTATKRPSSPLGRQQPTPTRRVTEHVISHPSPSPAAARTPVRKRTDKSG